MMRLNEGQLTLPTFLPARMNTRHVVCALGTMTLALAGCAKERPGADSTVAASSAMPASGTGAMGSMKGMTMAGKGDANGMRGMQGMGGDSGGMAGMQGMNGMMSMMGDMQKQVDGMMKGGPEKMKAMMPAHRQMVANMLGGMTVEMRRKNMSGDAAWAATVDSVRQDLVHMPELSGQEMMAAMPAHHARIMRLMGMHQAMSKNMKM